MDSLLLGIDIGTSACKIAVFSSNGTTISQTSEDYPVYHPNLGWVEQNPNEWWQSVCIATNRLLSKNNIDPKRITSIGIDGQSWSCIPIDKNGSVLCNNPIWLDSRAVDICKEIDMNIGANTLFEIGGNPLSPSYTLPKALWFKKHFPEIYSNTDKILQSNSFIVYKLTGSITQDISQSYAYHFFNMKKGVYDKELCNEIGFNFSLLPEIVACHEIVGKVTKTAAKETGLCEGTPVVAGGLDAACATLGAGVIEPGQTQEQGGQAGGMSICIDKYHSDPRLILGYHVIPNRLLLQGGTVGGGGVIRWFEEQFGANMESSAKKNGTSVFHEMDMEAANISPGSEGLVFLPYMSGERSPIWNPKAKGVYYGLDYSKTRAHMIRASLEGVAYSLKHNLDVAENAGVAVSELRAMGGAANSKLWTQMKADVTGKKVSVTASDTATTLGAAILAGVAIGVYSDFSDAINKTISIKQKFEPNKGLYLEYQKCYNIYIKIYEQLKCIMGEEYL